LLNRILSDLLVTNDLIYLHAQESAVKFYLKNGFSIHGEPFEEANIIHYKMIH
jgi:predicted GNAT family N-acyltransferase